MAPESEASGSARSSRTASPGSADEDQMSTSVKISRLVVYGLPLAFVVLTWFTSTSFPDFLEVDDSYVSSLQAHSSAIVNPRATITMASRPVDWQRTNGSTSYTQLPSAPRLLHSLLLGAGVRDLAWQVLIICLLGTALTVPGGRMGRESEVSEKSP
jgi:hypothetical protein